MALRIASDYRTTSTEAVFVIAGIIPIDLRIEERERLRRTKGIEIEIMRREQAITLTKWLDCHGQHAGSQDRNSNTQNKIVKEKKTRGNKLFYHTISDRSRQPCCISKAYCFYCQATDSQTHTTLKCQRWTRERHNLEEILGGTKNSQDLISQSSENKQN